jgi:uroporphyrinogen decarboxylase
MNRLQKALRRENQECPPVWLMRQAGRYHSHYQKMKERYSFIELCRIPDVACEVTMGPIRDFDFDAAILFSDLLFPLEAMGTGLRYDPGPRLDWHLSSPSDLKKLKGGRELASHMQFQADAMKLIRKALPAEKGLLGFVGGPLTLFCYAAEGTHSGDLASARAGITDGRYSGFVDKLLGMLVENMALQARAGADTVAVLDTCAGEFSPEIFRERAIPVLKELFAEFKKLCPDTPITYYSKGSTPEHWKHLKGLPISCLGIDWKHDLAQVLDEWSDEFGIQGNIDPDWMLLESTELEKRLREVFTKVKRLPASKRRGWVSGLGHGVLQKTPEQNVRLFVRIQREFFGTSS